MKPRAILIVLLLALVFAVPAYAAKPPCVSYYLVHKTDTLRNISVAVKVSPWDIFRANNDMMARPNYPIFYGMKLCIPAPETDKTFPAWVLDQPAARLYPRIVGKSLVLTAYNFPLNSNWYVKVNGQKIGKIKVQKKAAWTTTYKLPPGASMVCLKNQMTDFAYCQKVIR
jgi:hypothetical protein